MQEFTVKQHCWEVQLLPPCLDQLFTPLHVPPIQKPISVGGHVRGPTSGPGPHRTQLRSWQSHT